jgi:hypothetical protein
VTLRGPTTPQPRPWYGATAAWWVPFERGAKRKHGDDITTTLGVGQLTYTTELEVSGIQDPIAVIVAFFAKPPYVTYGLPAESYPRVWADTVETSPHRMPDNGLCLYYPWDPPERRWRSELGLLSLLNLTRDHLFFEHHWRCTGGPVGGIWLGPEAEHGLSERKTA